MIVVSDHALWRAAERWGRSVYGDQIEAEVRHGLYLGGWADDRSNVVTTPDGRRLIVVIEGEIATVVTVKEALQAPGGTHASIVREEVGGKAAHDLGE